MNKTMKILTENKVKALQEIKLFLGLSNAELAKKISEKSGHELHPKTLSRWLEFNEVNNLQYDDLKYDKGLCEVLHEANKKIKESTLFKTFRYIEKSSSKKPNSLGYLTLTILGKMADMNDDLEAMDKKIIEAYNRAIELQEIHK